MNNLVGLFRRYWRWIVLTPLGLFLMFQVYFFLQIGWWVSHNPTSTSFMRQQLAILREKNPKVKLRHKWVSYKRISRNLKRAIIASEDANFTGHEGVDWDALLKAYEKNSRKGKIVAGGSTITQQLAKNLFLSGNRSYFRKGQEILITYMLELWMDKERIFELYLNLVEFGTGVFGAEAAARHYYGTSAFSLSASQAAKLAAMLPKPRYFDKHRNSGYLMHRTALILRRMGSADVPR